MTHIKYTSASKAIECVQSGQRVFVHGSAQTPTMLLNELANQASRLRVVEIVSVTLYGEVKIAKKEFAESFHINSLFVSQPVREAVNEGYGNYVPIFLSEIPQLFRKKILPVDVAIVHVSPPDNHGFCSLGLSVDAARAAVDTAPLVIAQINPNVPRTLGDGMIHYSRFHAMVRCED